MISAKITRTIKAMTLKTAAAAFSLATAALSSGCVSNSNCLPPQVPDDIKVSVGIEGNKAVGEVTYIRQLHTSFITPSIENGPAIEWIIGKYQWNIAHYLQTNGFVHIFDEGRTSDLTPDNRQENKNFATQSRVTRYFSPQGIGDQFTGDQILLFGSSPILPSGATFYAIFNPNVFLHKVWSPESEQLYDKIAKKYGVYEELIMDWRERLAVYEIVRFLENNPGAKVALVFGADHEFKKYFSSLSNPPHFKTISFPRAVYDEVKQHPELCPIFKEDL